MANILILDDEKNQREILKDILELEENRVFDSENISSAMTVLEENDIDIILSDYKLKGETGEDFFDLVSLKYPHIEFILITAHGTIETAVRCMKKGAFAFLTKPVNIEELSATINKALESKNIKEENRKLKEIISGEEFKYEIIGESKVMVEVKNKIERLKDIDVPVLITGETGTGKEMAAKSLHYKGNRAGEAFIAVNMAGIPKNLIESELFGHIKGSFTGATKDKKGKFELAGDGTIFLDEIAEMDYELQSKLLRVLQESEIEKIGSEKTEKIRCRVIAATNRDLEEEIKEGRFRSDLYYRLNLGIIDIPALKKRDRDFELLIKYFIEKYHRKYGIDERKKEIYFKNLIRKYENYNFLGNVRELGNLVERYLIFPDETEDNDCNIIEDKNYQYAGKSLKDIEKEAILETIEYCDGNKNQAAKMLGISQRGIRYKLKEYED